MVPKRRASGARPTDVSKRRREEDRRRFDGGADWRREEGSAVAAGWSRVQCGRMSFALRRCAEAAGLAEPRRNSSWLSCVSDQRRSAVGRPHMKAVRLAASSGGHALICRRRQNVVRGVGAGGRRARQAGRPSAGSGSARSRDQVRPRRPPRAAPTASRGEMIARDPVIRAAPGRPCATWSSPCLVCRRRLVRCGRHVGAAYARRDDPAVPCTRYLRRAVPRPAVVSSRPIDSAGAGPQLRAAPDRQSRSSPAGRCPAALILLDLPAGRAVRPHRRADDARADRDRHRRRRLAARRPRRRRAFPTIVWLGLVGAAVPHPVDRRRRRPAHGATARRRSCRRSRRPTRGCVALARDQPVQRLRGRPAAPGRSGDPAPATGWSRAGDRAGRHRRCPARAFGAVAVANEMALRDRPTASSRFGPTSGADQPPLCDGPLAAGPTRPPRTCTSTATVDLRPIGSVDLAGRPGRRRLPLARLRRDEPPARPVRRGPDRRAGLGPHARRAAGAPSRPAGRATDTLDVQALGRRPQPGLPGDRRGPRRRGHRGRAGAALPGRGRRRDLRGGLPAGPLAGRHGRPPPLARPARLLGLPRRPGRPDRRQRQRRGDGGRARRAPGDHRRAAHGDGARGATSSSILRAR